MRTTLDSIWENKRGSSEVIAVALITGFIAFAGVGAFAMASDLTNSAESQVKDPKFELEAGNQKTITYTGEQPITKRNTHKIVIVQRNVPEGPLKKTVYNGSANTNFTDNTNITNIHPGDTILSETQRQSLQGGAKAQIIWYYEETDTEFTEGGTDAGTQSEEVINSKIISEFTIPDETVTGTSVLSNGTVHVNSTENTTVSTKFTCPREDEDDCK